MVMSEALRQGIIARQDADTLQRIALDEGMIDMHTDGLRKVAAGLTSIEEVERVTQAVAD
jgi:general secretion pathway protein E